MTFSVRDDETSVMTSRVRKCSYLMSSLAMWKLWNPSQTNYVRSLSLSSMFIF